MKKKEHRKKNQQKAFEPPSVRVEEFENAAAKLEDQEC